MIIIHFCSVCTFKWLVKVHVCICKYIYIQTHIYKESKYGKMSSLVNLDDGYTGVHYTIFFMLLQIFFFSKVRRRKYFGFHDMHVIFISSSTFKFLCTSGLWLGEVEKTTTLSRWALYFNSWNYKLVVRLQRSNIFKTWWFCMLEWLQIDASLESGSCPVPV